MVEDCTGFIEPLNLQCWFMNIFAGTMEIFAFVSIILIAGLAAKFKMSNELSLTMIALFVVLFSGYLNGIYLLVILLVGITSFFAIGRIVK